MDPISVVGIGGVVLGSKDLLNKLLGPTAEYLGDEIAGLVKKCNVNLDTIFRKALSKKKVESGNVSPRILFDIIRQGKYADSVIVQEYLAGILAKSSDAAGSDEGKFYAAMVDKMSTFQIKLHFLIYRSISSTEIFKPLDINFEKSRKLSAIFLPKDDISKLMGPDLKPFGQEFMDALYGLIAYRLIDDAFVFGEAKHVSESFPHINDSGLVAGPTQVGAQLFLWALAAESRNPRYIFSIPAAAFPDVDIISHGCTPAIRYSLKDRGNGKMDVSIEKIVPNKSPKGSP